MPLDEASNLFAFFVQRELRRMGEREEAHRSRGEDVKYDSVSRMATYEMRRGGVASRLHGEPIATYGTDDRILRWAWAGRAAGAGVTHADAIFHQGQTRGVPQLTMSIVDALDEEEATKLARLGAVAARAEAMHVRRSGTRLEFVGLFDRPRPADRSIEPAAARISVPPPEVAQRARDTPGPRAAPYRSLPPIREIYAPRTSSKPPAPEGERKKLREPSREIFLPVATKMLSALARGCPGYTQGLFVVIVDERQRDRIVVQLVCNDDKGLLRTVDSPTELLDAAAHMVAADTADGNAPWRRLSARVVPKPDGGATLHVEVI